MDPLALVDDHSRTIVHIDIDCFYAQVEMNKNPVLKNIPLGIQQKNIVVTSNYVAREYGVKKCMLITDAKKVCPNLQMVSGEDLHDYRQISYKVTAVLQKYSNLVERLGLDENFVDVSELTRVRLEEQMDVAIEGHTFGDTSDICDCGCHERLAMGSRIAQEMRDVIKSELNLTTCAGIGHNKLLAKIVCAKHKPNQQTLVLPNSALQLMLSLGSISRIPGIGVTLTEQLKSLNIQSVEDLQNATVTHLIPLLGSEKAKQIHNLSFGIDKSVVKSTGKPNSIGIEDSCKAISAEKEVKEKFQQLLKRLLILVSEDGRKPKTIKVTVRKYDKNNKFGNRESRQCNINTTLFNTKDLNNLSQSNVEKIMIVIMRLFYKLVDVKKPYHLTLLGLSFTKFLENAKASTLTKFLVKDIEVQSVTNIENQNENTVLKGLPSTSYTEDIENFENESAPKRFKGCEHSSENDILKVVDDRGSPSEIKMEDLNLSISDSARNENSTRCPPNVNEEVFYELPKDVQQEIWEEYKLNRKRENNVPSQPKKTKTNTILNYFVKR